MIFCRDAVVLKKMAASSPSFTLPCLLSLSFFQNQFVVWPPLPSGVLSTVMVVFVSLENLIFSCVVGPRLLVLGKIIATVKKNAVSFATGKGAVRPSKAPPHRCFEACLSGGGFASAAEGGAIATAPTP